MRYPGGCGYLNKYPERGDDHMDDWGSVKEPVVS